jgi:hypothetical protein
MRSTPVAPELVVLLFFLPLSCLRLFGLTLSLFEPRVPKQISPSLPPIPLSLSSRYSLPRSHPFPFLYFNGDERERERVLE